MSFRAGESGGCVVVGDGDRVMGKAIAHFRWSHNDAVGAIATDFPAKPEGVVDVPNNPFDGLVGEPVEFKIGGGFRTITEGKVTEEVEFNLNLAQLGPPRAIGTGDDRFGGDAIEAEGPVMLEGVNVLVAVGFVAPAVEVEVVFVTFDAGVADGEAPDAACGVLIGKTKGLLAANPLFNFLSPRGTGVIGPGLDFLAQGQAEFAAFEQQVGQFKGGRDFIMGFKPTQNAIKGVDAIATPIMIAGKAQFALGDRFNKF